MVAVSAGLRGVAVALMKVANDMRWLASGPRAGLHELKLERPASISRQVLCAGAGGGDQATKIDGEGPGKIADAAAPAGVRRFVLVSVFIDAWRGDESPGGSFELYIQAKRAAGVSSPAPTSPTPSPDYSLGRRPCDQGGQAPPRRPFQ